jgi:hypothetical protein
MAVQEQPTQARMQVVNEARVLKSETQHTAEKMLSDNSNVETIATSPWNKQQNPHKIHSAQPAQTHTNTHTFVRTATPAHQ